MWYAAHCAERMGRGAHELTAKDLALMDEQASRFQCSSCLRRFRTSPALQRHLLDHERDEAALEDEEEEEEKGEAGEEGEGGEGTVRKAGKRRAGAKKHLLKGKAKQVSEETPAEGES